MARRTKRYGPYQTKAGHLFWVDTFDDGTRKSIWVHREKMEKHLGRKLRKNEIIHHKNETPDDNRIRNFEIKSQNKHASEHHKPIEWVKVKCRWCKKPFWAQARYVRRNKILKRKGIHCSKKCNGKTVRQLQIQSRMKSLKR